MRRQGALPRTGFAIAAFAALLLAVCPLPAAIATARPDWLSLVVIYWVLRAPQAVGMGSAWLLGLLFDALAGGALGPRALALAVVAYLALALRGRMLHYAAPQQAAAVAAISACGLLLWQWAQGLAGHGALEPWFLAGSLTAAACWPVLGMQAGSQGRLEGWNDAA